MFKNKFEGMKSIIKGIKERFFPFNEPLSQISFNIRVLLIICGLISYGARGIDDAVHLIKENTLKEKINRLLSTKNQSYYYHLSFEGKQLEIMEPDALVITDLQDYFLDKSKAATKLRYEKFHQDIDNTINKIIQLVEKFRRNGKPIIIIQYAGLGPLNNRLIKALSGYENITIIDKYTDSVMEGYLSGPQIKSYLDSNGIKTIQIAGINESACIAKTAGDLLGHGFNVLLHEQSTADPGVIPLLDINATTREANDSLRNNIPQQALSIFPKNLKPVIFITRIDHDTGELSTYEYN